MAIYSINNVRVFLGMWKVYGEHLQYLHPGLLHSGTSNLLRILGTFLLYPCELIT
jgi:hypothetical protein